jgi:hypothetical protein
MPKTNSDIELQSLENFVHNGFHGKASALSYEFLRVNYPIDFACCLIGDLRRTGWANKTEWISDRLSETLRHIQAPQKVQDFRSRLTPTQAAKFDPQALESALKSFVALWREVSLPTNGVGSSKEMPLEVALPAAKLTELKCLAEQIHRLAYK